MGRALYQLTDGQGARGEHRLTRLSALRRVEDVGNPAEAHG